MAIFALMFAQMRHKKMEINEGFRVEITSGSDRFWRYNTAVTCGCFDASDRGIDFIGTEDIIAPVGSNLKERPADYPAARKIEFETAPCDHILMYLYVIPHTLPAESAIADCKPFDMRIKVMRGRAIVLDRIFPINSWSGASIELRLPR